MKSTRMLDKAIEELGVGHVLYIFSCGTIGLGIGCLIGYVTKDTVANTENKKEN